MFVFDPTADRHDPRAPGGAWTGGQWSVMRMVLGGWLAVRIAGVLPGWRHHFGEGRVFGGGPLLGIVPNVFDWFDDPAVGAAITAIAAAMALLLAIGWRTRTAALLLAYLLPCLATHQPQLRLPDALWTALLLAAFATVPKSPFLSVDARKRTDPDGGWTLPQQTWHLMWLLQVVGSGVALVARLRDPAWREFSPAMPVEWLLIASEAGLCLSVLPAKGPARCIAWTATFATRIALLLLGGGGARDEALLLLQLFAFDPGWLPGAPPLPRVHLFFDGSCGVCHRFVRMVLAEDHRTHFWVSPLQGRAVAELLDAETRARLPDSVVVRTGDGVLHMKSGAVVTVLTRLGGLWRIAAVLLRAVPRPLRDCSYDLVARLRKKLFAPPASACPLLSPALRARFLE